MSLCLKNGKGSVNALDGGHICIELGNGDNVVNLKPKRNCADVTIGGEDNTV